MSSSLAKGMPTPAQHARAYIEGYCHACTVLADAFAVANARFERERFLIDTGCIPVPLKSSDPQIGGHPPGEQMNAENTEITRQAKIRIYVRLLRRYGEKALIRHMQGERLLRAVDRRTTEGRP